MEEKLNINMIHQSRREFIKRYLTFRLLFPFLFLLPNIK